MDQHEEVPVDPELLHNPRGASWHSYEIHIDLNRAEITIRRPGYTLWSGKSDLAGPRQLSSGIYGLCKILITNGGRACFSHVGRDRFGWRTWDISNDERRQVRILFDTRMGRARGQVPSSNPVEGGDRGPQPLAERDRGHDSRMDEGKLSRLYDRWRSHLPRCLRLWR